ncbi:hypothetical protein [Corynebacterium wankanglinii]|uniref:Uncharacterized protein n=1 Tax=Corynebacterium wankanglinii TaxID=2735136 RepID=A0A838CKE7_9CORY|nr:hypothetical protein [Corynebacterium wankanglinii]MBA1835435.1 hypothetical protein [Corynebacterium wankanglinii]
MSDEELFRRMRRSATVSRIAVCVALAVSLVNLYDRATANYELETGEYLHCTPQGGNQLACEVKHRSETPEVAQK